MANTENPRDADGEKLCAWCGKHLIQPPTGRTRDYCKHSCRQRAYEERQTQKRIAQAVSDAYPLLSRYELYDSGAYRDETEPTQEYT